MFKKVKMVSEKDEWILEIANKEIPVTAIATAVKVFLSVILVFWAYNIWQYDALQYVNYLSNPDNYHNCQPIADGNKIAWNCTATNKNNVSVTPVWQL